jgi:hypothetical protein
MQQQHKKNFRVCYTFKVKYFKIMKLINLCVAITCYMYITTACSQWLGTNPVYLNTGQSAGIGTSNPQAPLHIIGDGNANAQGWQKAIIMDKSAALIWKGSQNSYFMAYPSNTPFGDFYQGISAGIGTGAVVDYTAKVFGSNTPPAGIPKGTTQIFKNLLVTDIFGINKRSIGVNILVPKRSVDIVNNGNTNADAQLRLTHTAHTNPNRGIWTDFQTTNTGNLFINPRRFINGQSQQRNVGIAIKNPIRRLDVYDSLNAQLRLTSKLPTGLNSPAHYTDFKTTHTNNNFGAGNLLINPSFGTNIYPGFKPKAVIINMLDSNTALNTDLALYVNGQQNLRYALEGDTNHVKVMVWDSVNNGRIKWRHADSLADRDWLIYGTTNKIPHSVDDHIYTRNKVNIEAAGTGSVAPALLNVNQSTGMGAHVRVTGVGDGVVARINDGTGVLGSTFAGVGVRGVSPIGPTNYAVYSDGDLFVNGDVTANNYFSDSLLKTNIDTIGNAISIVSQLKPKSFYYDTLNNLNINFPAEKQYGFMAQDVSQILPELVTTKIKPAEFDTLGNIVIPATPVKRLNYNAFFALLVRAMQQQDDTIDVLKSELQTQKTNTDSLANELATLKQQFTQMKNCLQPLLNFLCGNNNLSKIENMEQLMNIINVELSNGDAIVLEQNVPNPFNEQTSIKYYIPDNINYAQIIFTDMHGRIIKTVDINQTGHGQLKVYAANLSQGIYQYSILVDGKVIETKKMVVEK